MSMGSLICSGVRREYVDIILREMVKDWPSLADPDSAG